MDSAWLPIDHVRLILWNLVVRCFDLVPWVIEQKTRVCVKMAQCEIFFALFLPGHADHVEIISQSILLLRPLIAFVRPFLPARSRFYNTVAVHNSVVIVPSP